VQALRWLGWFMLANTGVLLAVSSQYLTTARWPETARGLVFLVLALPGHYALLAFLPWLPLALLALLLPRRAVVVGAALTAYVVLVMVVIVDTQVFALYRFHLNGMVVNLLTGGAAGQQLPISWATFAMAGAILVALALGEWWLAQAVWRWVARHRRLHGFAVLGLMVAVFLAGQGFHAWADALQDRTVTRYVRYLPWPQLARMDETFDRWGWIPKQQRVALPERGGGTSLNYPLAPVVCEPPPEPLNLLVIVIDGWRFDTLGPKVSPHLDRLARESWTFANHFSSGNATRFGVFGLFYGLYASYWHAMLAERKGAVLVDELARQGYRMGIFGSASLASPEFDRTVFNDVRHLVDLQTEGRGPVQRDRTITDKFKRFVDNRANRPFFGFLFYDSTHGFTFPTDRPAPFQPYWQAINHLELNNDFDASLFFNRFRNSVHYVDALAGEAIAHLRARGLLERTVVVVTGDHGEEFNDNRLNYWGHNGNFSRYQTQVPLIVHWPGRGAREYTHRTSHLDVAPTLMTDLLGCTTPPDRYSQGRHLLQAGGRPFLVVGSWHSLAIRQPERVTVLDNLGQVDVLGPGYRPIPGARPDGAVMVQVLGEMGRFFAGGP